MPSTASQAGGQRRLRVSLSLLWEFTSDTNHPIFVVSIDYNIDPGHTTWIIYLLKISFISTYVVGFLLVQELFTGKLLPIPLKVQGKKLAAIYSLACALCFLLRQKQGFNG